MEMIRCPLCFRLPNVERKMVGSVELWEIGCTEHSESVARQPSLDMAVAQWNEVVAQLPVCR